MLPGRKSDEQLVASAISGSESAWSTLVKRHEKRLYNHALRIVGHPDDAMDLLQDTFVSVYRNLSSFRGDSAFTSWMFRIATFRCVDHLRRKKYNTEEFDELTHPGGDADPLAQLQTAKNNKEILTALQSLPFDQRQVVELKFFQHFTFEEIAGQLGVSSNTVKTRLYTALRRMRGDTQLEKLAC